METLIYYIIGHLALLGLVFLVGYIAGTNIGERRLRHYAMRRCDNDYADLEGIEGIVICNKCGFIRSE